MAQGTIRKLVSDRGFGFIVPEGEPTGEKDLFFHRSNVEAPGYDALREGVPVTYEIGTDERRGTPQATHVQPVGTSEH
jgi:cold shock CspA family protein